MFEMRFLKKAREEIQKSFSRQYWNVCKGRWNQIVQKGDGWFEAADALRNVGAKQM